MLKKIISGAQTGADQAGLKAAKKMGLETGGWIPKGGKTEVGEDIQLISLYNLTEHSSDNYAPRTYANVRDSDGTIRFARNFNSPGEKCTYKAISQYKKPYIDVHIDNPISKDKVVSWIKSNNIETLNVAGNKESSAPGIEDFVEEYLIKVMEPQTAMLKGMKMGENP